jgi:hypothetical protein
MLCGSFYFMTGDLPPRSAMPPTGAEQPHRREARDRSENLNIGPNARVPSRYRPGLRAE